MTTDKPSGPTEKAWLCAWVGMRRCRLRGKEAEGREPRSRVGLNVTRCILGQKAEQLNPP